MKKIETTRKKILWYLASGKKLDSVTAYEIFKTMSLQQHINVLRNRGNDIKTEMKVNKITGVRFAEYSMFQ